MRYAVSEIQKPEAGPHLPGGCRERWVPAGLHDGVGGIVLSTLTAPLPATEAHAHGVQRASKASSVLRAAGPRYTPINDSSFMKKEQPDGNLCRIEPATENVCQASGLFPPASWILSALKIRHQNGTGRESLTARDTALQAAPTFCGFMTPVPQGMTRLIKSVKQVYYLPENKPFLSGPGGQVIYCLKEIPSTIF